MKWNLGIIPTDQWCVILTQTNARWGTKQNWHSHSHLYLIAIKIYWIVWCVNRFGAPKLWGVCGYLNKWIFLNSNDTHIMKTHAHTHTPNTHLNEYWLSILIYVFSSPITHNKIVNKFIYFLNWWLRFFSPRVFLLCIHKRILFPYSFSVSVCLESQLHDSSAAPFSLAMWHI